MADAPLTPDALLAATAELFPHEELVVALSGGPDSAVAAWLATRLDPVRTVTALFVDHGWEASSLMREAAQRVAARLDVDLTVLPVANSETETDARKLRLAALETAAADRPIVTGHHADDVAETLVLNLVRGAGSAGLGSIPGHRAPFVRPLLDLRRSTLRSVAESLGLPFADDPANHDSAHRRSVVRHDIVPRLEEMSAGAGAALTRSAQLLAGDDSHLRAMANRVLLRRERAAVSVPFAALTMLPEAVSSRVVRRALRLLNPPYAGDRSDVARVIAAVHGPAAALTGGLRCEREGAFVTIHDPRRPVEQFIPLVLNVPGQVATSTHVVSAAAKRPDGGRRFGRLGVALLDEPGAELVVRPAAAGERIDIGTGTKLVRDAMAEGGVPVRLRPGWPVVAQRGKIAWIAGVRPAAWARPQPDARELELTTERLGCWTV